MNKYTGSFGDMIFNSVDKIFKQKKSRFNRRFNRAKNLDNSEMNGTVSDSKLFA